MRTHNQLIHWMTDIYEIHYLTIITLPVKLTVIMFIVLIIFFLCIPLWKEAGDRDWSNTLHTGLSFSYKEDQFH